MLPKGNDMGITIGVNAAGHIAAAVVEGEKIVNPINRFPDGNHEPDSLSNMPASEILEKLRQQISDTSNGRAVESVGIAFPGIIRNGVVEECPNIPQMKGQELATGLTYLLATAGLGVKVHVLNDADAMAAGIAAARGHLDKIVRLWFLGSGIGYGRYPLTGGAGEGGHTIVSLDPKESLCSCGGSGHLEGIMGYRAMRLRFLDLEPDEVFDHAKSGDPRCVEFVNLWHRALAAATATSIHLDGPGKFFISGPYAKRVDTEIIQLRLKEMVKMSPLQGSSVEVVHTTDEIAIVGAAISATTGP
ncbi:MAG TPA: ROK family protein [Blastocatellia bacterium]|nr:ROK family protein [Blastocatellia bacterium]